MLWRVDDLAVGAVFRGVRHRRALRQTDVAGRCGVSQQLVSLIERGRLEETSLRTLRRVGSVLGIRLRLDAGWRGIELRELLDRDHASVVGELARQLGRDGWRVEVEATYSRYGERGSIDLVAVHPAARILLVVEVKTVVVDMQDALRRIDAKRRLAVAIAAERGWIPRREAGAWRSVPMLAVADHTTNRRRISMHLNLLARYDLRGRRASAWLRKPAGTPSGLLVFRNLPLTSGSGARRAGRQRVRSRGAGSSVKSAASGGLPVSACA